MDVKGSHECLRLENLLRDARIKLSNRQDSLARAKEAVSVARGEIAFAENTLQRIVDQISATAASAAGCAFGEKRDCVAAAIGLANEQARQLAKIKDLNTNLRDRILNRDSLQTEVNLDQTDVQRIRSAMNANGC